MTGTSGNYSQPTKLHVGTAVTDANGQATVTFPAGRFTTPPLVSAAVANPNASAVNGSWAEVFTVTAASVVLQVWQGRGVLLGGQTTQRAGAGITVHSIAIAP